MTESSQLTPEERRRRDAADVDLEPTGDDDEFSDPTDRFAGDEPVGRLVAPDEGRYEDIDSEAVADDVGFDGGAVSAEEAAVHEQED
jgi:hypothetical protein